MHDAKCSGLISTKCGVTVLQASMAKLAARAWWNMDDLIDGVMDIDQLTFENGGAFPQSGGRTAYIYAVPGPLNLDRLTGSIHNIGIDNTSNSKTKIPGSQTNVNTVIVDADCQTVITSHPGIPANVSPNDPRITGYPDWWPPSKGFTFRH